MLRRSTDSAGLCSAVQTLAGWYVDSRRRRREDAGCTMQGGGSKGKSTRGLWPLVARRTRVGMGGGPAGPAGPPGRTGRPGQGRQPVLPSGSAQTVFVLCRRAALPTFSPNPRCRRSCPMHTRSHHAVASARRVRVPCPDPESSPRACAACRLMFRVLPRDLLISTSSCTMYHVPGRSDLRPGGGHGGR